MTPELLHTFYLPHGKRYQEIRWHPAERVLVWQWWGLIPDEYLSDAFWHVMQEGNFRNPVGCVADHTYMEGGWSANATESLVKAFSGVKSWQMRIAVVQGPNTDLLTELSTQTLQRRLPEHALRIFSSFEPALAWAASTLHPTQKVG